MPAWYFETIEKISAFNNSAVYFLVIKNDTSFQSQKTSFTFRIFQKFEDWWFVSESDAGKMISVECLLNENNSTTLNTISHFEIIEESLEKLRLMQFHIIYAINFDSREKENLSQAAVYGLWYIKFGYGEYSDCFSPGFWEVMDDCPVVGSYLVARKNGVNKVIGEGTTAAVPYSRKNTYNSIAWKSSSYLPNRVKEVLQSQSWSTESREKLETGTDKKLPGNLTMVFLFVRNVLRYLIYKIRTQKKDHFTLLLSYTPFQFQDYTANDFLKISLPEDSFFADPFVVKKDDIDYIFFEEFIYSRNKAHISVMEVQPDKRISEARVVLDQTSHLSYPFVFHHEGEFYLIPETSSNKTVELYKASKFPDQWEFVMNLMEGKVLIDSTLHFENGFWWLFGSSINYPYASTNDELFLFYSDELFSANWIPHPKNPIATHVSNCRPAGRLFRRNGKLYRPAQNNASKQYGYDLNINEVVVLSTQEYEEKNVYSFDTRKLKLKACHNIDFTDNLTVIDGIRH